MNNDYDEIWSVSNDVKQAVAESAMEAECWVLVEEHIRNKTDLFWESMSYDAWYYYKELDNVANLSQNTDSGAALGALISSISRKYIYSVEWERIKEDWEDYVD